MNNNAKEVAIQSQQTGQKWIPFGKPARIGNFKIWKSKYTFDKGADGKKIKPQIVGDCINVSILDGSWMVRIPQGFEQFAMLSLAYSWSLSEDKDEQVKGTGYLRTAISNMYYVSCICNGFFHHGVEMVASAYANPSLLQDTEDGKSFRQDAIDTIGRFLEWRKEYEKHVADNEPTEADMKSDQVAEEMLEELNKE